MTGYMCPLKPDARRTPWQKSQPDWRGCRSNGIFGIMSETEPGPAPALNPGHNLKLLADVFRRHGRIHIPNVLTADSAQRVYRCLAKETDYNLVINEKDETFDLSPQELAKFSKEKPAEDGSSIQSCDHAWSPPQPAPMQA